MHSNELAELAGVTVRRLRHYHQIGLLPEPERWSNGYRRYTVKDLATVLRILSFTELGVPLSEVRRVIDDQEATTALLDRIDEQAAGEVERLTARRAAIAELRRGGVAPDLPPALIPYAAILRSRAEATDRERLFDREQLALIRHFSDDASMPWLVAAMENLSLTPARYLAVIDEFAALDADAAPEQTARLESDMVDILRSAVPDTEAPPIDERAATLMLTHQDEYHNAAQRRVMATVLAAAVPPHDAAG